MEPEPSCSAAPPPSVHWLPCKIHYDGPAATSEYFQPSPAAAGDGTLQCSLRGRQLYGRPWALPPGYTGALVTAPGGTTDLQERPWSVAATFDALAYWVHDAAPTATDGPARALTWLALAQQAHAPVDAAAVEQHMQQQQQAAAVAAAASQPGSGLE